MEIRAVSKQKRNGLAVIKALPHRAAGASLQVSTSRKQQPQNLQPVVAARSCRSRPPWPR
jgi:hypothetical protein